MGEGNVDEEMEKMIGEIKIGLECTNKNEVSKGGNRSGWDEDCKEKKKEVRKELRKWRKEKSNGEEYRKKKKEYTELCHQKKEEENKRFEEEAEKARTEEEVWKVVNRERKRRKRVNQDIEMVEWKKYFLDLLGGVERKVIKGGKYGREKDEEEEISREEMAKVLGIMKDGKAPGIDEIPNEVWKYGGEELEEWAWIMCNRVWRGEGWPELWKEGVVIPIVKKGKGEDVKDYRGVTLMPTLYKIYVTILSERLKIEVEEKKIESPNQTGFRKGMGVMDNIYVLNYLVNKRIKREKGAMIAMFVDLKAAFDSLDRGEIEKVMVKKGIREGLIKRVSEIFRETKSRVKVGEQVGDSFWLVRGVRQGCPLSPLLFNLLISDLEEEMKRKGWGGVRIGKEKIYTLAYADDIVLMAEDEEGMAGLITGLEKYLDGKKLNVNVEKTKIMRFRKGGGRKKEWTGRWKGKKLEEVKEYKYLGYILQTNGDHTAHIRERIKKAAGVMKQIWGIGKRRFKKNWRRRMWLFDTLVWPVIGYGAEIWGWKERKDIESLQERYIRWTLGADWRTPGYMVREEAQRDKLSIRSGKRAWKFETKLREGKGGELARKCLMEVEERRGRAIELTRWEEERREFFNDREIEDGIGVNYEELEKRERERQLIERWEMIEESKYNKWYKMIKKEGVPKYLEKGWGERRWIRIARFRLGNEVREGMYWEKEDNRKCRICEWEEETWEHVWEGCRRGMEDKGSWQENVVKILGEDGLGEEWMKELEGARGANEGE